ncbi:MAG: hypothetical protein Q8K00_20520 [Syntrophales bacterium]|nr:hypothetical protein [Syntrophales bacterium]
MEYIFFALAVFMVLFFSLIVTVFIKEVRKRYKQCGSLLRALLESNVTAPLGEYDVIVFGTVPSRLRIFKEDNGMGTPASVTFEICRKRFFSYDRYDYSIAGEDLPELARLLRKAAGV